MVRKNRRMGPPPKPSYAIHQLPAAPRFVGREAELNRLRAWWRAGGRGVFALVGLGGSGKTALAAAFVNGLLESSESPAGGLFVWSFYVEPDAGLFLREAHRHLGGAEGGPAKGTGVIHLLRDALARRGPSLIVLDGLERVQRPGDTSGE